MRYREILLERDDHGPVLICFDIDDTLMRTSATVMVIRPDGSSQELTASEFNHYKLKSGERFDFGQFTDAKLFRDTSKPIENLWKTAQKSLNVIDTRPGSRVVIVTARSDMDDKDEFLKTFEDHGLDMTKVHVFRAGNVNAGSSAENKKIIIRKLLKTQPFVLVKLFDDHPGNLHAFLSLKKEFTNVTFEAYQVEPSGKIHHPIIA